MINRDRAVQTFIDLARIDSPSGQEDDVARWTVARLQALGFSVQEDTFGNLVARQEHNDPSPIVLSAHMDTVQPCIGIQPRIEGDLIVSDGTTIVGGDCKAGGSAVLEALESAGVAHLAKRRIGELSVGQQQRVLVARALVGRPGLLVLDEPAAGVDAHGEELLNDLLQRLNRENGISVLLVSHDIGAVMRQANVVACINQSLVFHGEPHDLTQDELARLYGFPVEVLLHDALHEHR